VIGALLLTSAAPIKTWPAVACKQSGNDVQPEQFHAWGAVRYLWGYAWCRLRGRSL